MSECYKCGVSDERERLFDAISNKGLVKLCKKCSEDEGLPLVQPVDLNKPEKSKTVYERLSAMANLDPEKHKMMLVEMSRENALKKYKQDRERRGQDDTLRGIVNSNYDKKKSQPRTDLVANFHWVIMRARRSKKLTQKQLAEHIGEPEASIVSAEGGVILNNSDSLIRKLENYLGIKIRNIESPYSSEDLAKKEIREKLEREGKLDGNVSENLTIADLKEMNEEKERGSSGGFFSFLKRKKKKQDVDSEGEVSGEDGDISNEEADNILFGK